MADLDLQPGFRRRFRLTPANGIVQAEVEDDFHCMSVVIRHDGVSATGVEADMRRAPWTTCPGAPDQLQQTFAGVALASFGERGEKQANCTHLYDLALLASVHAFDDAPTVYDIFVSDPVDGVRRAEIWRNGETVLRWTECRFLITEPEAAAGIRLDKLRPWIASLAPELQEPARLLQWGNMLANGRVIPLADQSDAMKMPPNCFTFQPQRAVVAKRVGVIRDFSQGQQPLDGFEPLVLTSVNARSATDE
jgi:hypothetical protein